MDKFSHSEIEFTRKSIEKNIRLDGRSIDQMREEKIEKWNNSQADNSINIKRGHSEIIMNLVFKTSLSTLKKLKLTHSIEGIDNSTHNKIYSNGLIDIFFTKNIQNEFSSLETNFREMNPCFQLIEKWLDTHSIGLEIEVIEISNDGNTFDMFFSGLKAMLQSIEIPDIDNLNKEISSCLTIPHSNSFAYFNDRLLKDPSLIEEASSDGIIRIFELENKPVAFIFQKLNDTNQTVQQILNDLLKSK